MSKIGVLTTRHPIVRGMAAYALMWPTSNLIQQTMSGKRFENYDWQKCVNFCLYGSLFVAPTLFIWVRFSSRLFPGRNFRTAVSKAFVEQLTYGPFAACCFFFGMGLLEGKELNDCIEEVKVKFLPTYKTALCFWPFIQTCNFYFVPERNRVVVVGTCSLVWTCFLSYMHNLDKEAMAKKETVNISKQLN